MVESAKDPAQYLLPLYMNGLSGRMLRMPANRSKKQEILFVYGHHSSLERVFGVAEFLNKYGGVTIPDLPGFGGMESYYKIGEVPTLENMADYLAAFIKLRYKNKRLTIISTSLGFLIVTKMLQKYPEIAKKVDLVCSIAGFTNRLDFGFKPFTSQSFRYLTSLLSGPISSTLIRHLLFRKSFIHLAYWLVENRHSKLRYFDKKERARRIDFEVRLWQCNDVRTYMKMAQEMFSANLGGTHVNLPVYHVAIENDRYFNNVMVEQHMREIYKDFTLFSARVPAHAPSVVATSKEAQVYVPAKLRQLLRKSS